MVVAEAVAVTKASAARIARRRGHEDDLLVAETAIALQAAWGLSERSAIDLALTIHHAGGLGRPSKIPRGGKAGILVGYALPDQESFHGQNRDIRRKLKAGKLRPDVRVVRAVARLLHRIRTRKV
jgi:hypothetical protein